MLRPWDLQIVLERDLAMPAYLQIAHALIDAIRRGRLASGSALPGTRELATRVGVNRKTIQQSYDELVAQGWLTTEATRGTFVSAALPLVPEATQARIVPGAKIAEFSLRRLAPDLPVLLPQPGTLIFDDGAPDTRLMPAELLARAYRRALLLGSRHNRLGYGDPRGSLSLRQAVAEMLRADRGLDCTEKNICITRGSQMGIFLSARLLAQSGDAVAIESVSYPPAREAFRAMGAKILSIEMDDQGMRLDRLEALCRQEPVRAVYVTPHHHFPTTAVLPPERRIRLLALAEQFGFVIVEDDYDHEFHFSHRPMLPLASAHGWGKLIYIGSLSKLLSPSLRIGYLVAAESVAARAAQEIMMIDRQGDPVTEAMAADIMTAGVLKSHARKVLRIYAERRECLAAALQQQLGDAVEFFLPPGGLALWVNFARHINLPALAAAGLRHGVGITPGQAFAVNGDKIQGARLGFGSLNESELQEAVRRLRLALADASALPATGHAPNS
jgi:GntR family transcriptional regulator/MocR family aminotransferase